LTEGDGGGASITISRFSGDASAPNCLLKKARGSVALPAVVQQNDEIGRYNWQAFDGGAHRGCARLAVSVVAASPGATDMESRLVLHLTAAGAGVVSEALRYDHAGGLQLGGANPVIDGNRHFRLRSYTIATLPSAAATAGQMIYCSDLGGGGGQLNSDAANWRRVAGGGTQIVSSDAAFTLTPLVSAEWQKHTGTLTANRVITLSGTNAYPGARFHVTRTGGGAFSLDLGGLKNLATNTWAEVVFDGAVWSLAAYGAL
jgi:hypothetical protein